MKRDTCLIGRADRNRLSASLDRPDELIMGQFDFVQTLRIVTNLVENSLKYSPVDSKVEITGGMENHGLVVRVVDRGAGIFAGDGMGGVESSAAIPIGARGMSAGLGLTIARGLAAAQGGRLEYRSRSGGGTIFTLSLPLD